MKQFSDSCVQNQDPILTIIQPLFTRIKHVLEIGSGTGQHAVHFARHMPHLTWQASDQAQYLPSINAWITEEKLANTPKAIELNVSNAWNNLTTEAIFSANTAHIMSQTMVEDLFIGVGNTLKNGGIFTLYGPFNYNGKYTSTSNAQFDIWLKAQNSRSAIRHFEDLNALANQNGLILMNDFEMPANNRLLHWQKTQ